MVEIHLGRISMDRYVLDQRIQGKKHNNFRFYSSGVIRENIQLSVNGNKKPGCLFILCPWSNFH